MLQEEFDGDESRMYKLHKKWGTLESDYYPNKPKPLSPRLNNLLSTFYSARRERKHDEHVDEATLLFFADKLPDYEQDLAIIVMKQLDSCYMQLCSDKLKRDLERSRRGN